ncbi:MAG: hypothetical protein ACK2U1_13985 [Anaerolineales bacterium]
MVISKYYQKKGLWLLFSAAAFLIHIWAILQIFQDLSWIAERTNMWDAIGVGAYGLTIALIESIFLFLIAFLLGFLVSTRWDPVKRISLMGTLVIIISIWAILGQLYFILGWSFPASWIQILANTEHPLRILYLIALVFVGPSVLLPVVAQLKSDKLSQMTYEIFDRLSTLVILYLVLDIASIVIVIIRNI